MALLFEDTFTEASSIDLNQHTPDIGTGWTKSTGTFVTTGSSFNTVNPTAGPALYFSDDLGISDSYIEWTSVNSKSSDAGAACCLRLVDADNWVGIGVDPAQGNNVAVIVNVAGVKTVYNETSKSDGSVYRLEAEGSTLRFYIDGVQQGSDITNGSHQSETRHGMYSVDNNPFREWNTRFAVGSLGGGGNPPTGTTTVDSVTTTETTADVNYSYDAADETGFNYRIDGGATVDAGLSNPIQITGLAASTAYTVEVQAYNGDGAGSWSTAFPFSTDAATTTSLTTEPLKNNTGQLLSNESGVIADVYNVVDGVLALRKTGLISDGLGVVTISDASLSPATEYRVVIQLSGDEEGIARITSV